MRSGHQISLEAWFLLSCYEKGKRPAGQKSVVLNLYQKEIEAQRRVGGTISAHLDTTALSAIDKALYSYIRLITIRSMPIFIVECSEFGSFCRHNVHRKGATIIEVMFSLVELVEERISIELSRTKEAVMYVGWSDTGTHYVDLYACNCAPQTIRSNMTDRVEEIMPYSLLGVASMGHMDDEEAEAGSETASFNADMHLNFFKEAFGFDDLNFVDSCMSHRR